MTDFSDVPEELQHATIEAVKEAMKPSPTVDEREGLDQRASDAFKRIYPDADEDEAADYRHWAYFCSGYRVAAREETPLSPTPQPNPGGEIKIIEEERHAACAEELRACPGPFSEEEETAYGVGHHDGAYWALEHIKRHLPLNNTVESVKPKYEDKGPFVMSRYLSKEDLYQAMHDRIEALESERQKILEIIEGSGIKTIYNWGKPLRDIEEILKSEKET